MVTGLRHERVFQLIDPTIGEEELAEAKAAATGDEIGDALELLDLALGLEQDRLQINDLRVSYLLAEVGRPG